MLARFLEGTWTTLGRQVKKGQEDFYGRRADVWNIAEKKCRVSQSHKEDTKYGKHLVGRLTTVPLNRWNGRASHDAINFLGAANDDEGRGHGDTPDAAR